MGISRWDDDDWDKHASSAPISSGTTSSIFTSKSLDKDLDPSKIAVRESVDSHLNPNSTPIILAVDETGSMGILATNIIKKGLGVLIKEIYDRKPVPDPHVMLMAFGDAWCDNSPLQVTQFEADIRLVDQCKKFFIEGNGGGNGFESYNLPWYFAATKTKCDAFTRKTNARKGYLFTVGDEPPPPHLEAKHVAKFLGGGLQSDLSTADLLTMVQRNWEVFHIMVAEGSHYSMYPSKTKEAWNEILGERAVVLTDHEDLAEVVVSIMQTNEGADPIKVAGSWSGGTALVVREALSGLTPALTSGSTPAKGVTRL